MFSRNIHPEEMDGREEREDELLDELFEWWQEQEDEASAAPVCFHSHIHEGDVYYDPRTNQFLQLRERQADQLIFGGFCTYYEDAKTTIVTQHLPLDYLNGLVKIEDIGQFEGAEYCDAAHGYRIKGKARREAFPPEA